MCHVLRHTCIYNILLEKSYSHSLIYVKYNFQVYAVEASNMCTGCERIVKQNNYNNVISVVYGKVEDVKIDGLTQVDIIVSEWMGFYLLHESMLTSLIAARERWLSPDGLMVPAVASIYACPVNMNDLHSEALEFWNDVSGFDMSPLIPVAEGDVYARPAITCLKPDQCLALPKCLATFDLAFVQPEDIASFAVNLNFAFTKDGLMDGIACWFDVIFQSDDETCKKVTLSTSPQSPATHWKQTTVLIPQRIPVKKDQSFACHLELDQDEENPRHYNIGLQLADEYSGADDMQESITEQLVNAMEKNSGTS